MIENMINTGDFIKTMSKIGVTEQGDAALDFSWVDKLGAVAGAIVITKELSPAFREVLLANQERLMLHLSCTGYGRTVIEPNVPTLSQTLEQLDYLLQRGFPLERLVVRVDPIIPTEKGIATAKKVIEAMYHLGVRRIRVSVLDMYRHVQERFQRAGLPLPYGNSFQASTEQFKALDRTLLRIMCEHPGLTIESCSEPALKVPEKVGCVGKYECDLFGVNMTTGYKQRKSCLCCGEKVELLSTKHPCAHGCLYCYWQD